MSAEYDVGVVGAGIIGLAHAYHLARRGLRVLVFERHRRAQGASVRNFGMIWPIGQPPGSLYDLARRSRDLWLEVLGVAGLWHRPSGSLHLAYHEDEAQVLGEFAESAGRERSCELWTPARVAASFPAVVRAGLRAALWSPLELAVDPRQVLAGLPAWLSKAYSVDFAFDTPVLAHDLPRVLTPGGEYRVNRLLICTGIDFRELCPTAFAHSGLVPVKLQMMRSQAFGENFRLGTHLAAGLTLRHYASFAHCPTLPSLARRLDAELPEYGRYGIHVLVSQNGAGELTLGDSHEYGDAIEPFDKAYIDDLILGYLKTFLNVPGLEIASRWHGTYAKHPAAAYVVARPAPGVLAVTGLGGAGMTLSLADWFGGEHDRVGGL
jgi:FAD dependent oxidoreductase TIGR03364